MTDKVKQIIWVFDIEDNKKKRINLQTLLNRANHSFRHENIKYFALEKDRDEFAKDCRSRSLVHWAIGLIPMLPMDLGSVNKPASLQA